MDQPRPIRTQQNAPCSRTHRPKWVQTTHVTQPATSHKPPSHKNHPVTQTTHVTQTTSVVNIIQNHISIPIPNHMTYNAKRKHLLRQNKNLINHNKIFNYSNWPLNEQETNLSRANICPRISPHELCYLDSFINRMSAKYNFKGKPFTPHPFHKPFGWIPPPPKNESQPILLTSQTKLNCSLTPPSQRARPSPHT